MRTLFSLFCALFLIASLANGAVVHAAEVAGQGEVTATTEWLHLAGDHDQVPPDTDKNYPHHHTSCQGHDVGVPFKAGAPVGWTAEAGAVIEPRGLFVREALATRTLRPPIA
jgi:hypothetical protein